MNRKDQEEYERIKRHRRRLEMRRRKGQKRRRIKAVAQLCCFLLSLSTIYLICSKHYEKNVSQYKEELHSVSAEVVSEKTMDNKKSKDLAGENTVAADASVRIGSVGDITLHLPIIKAYGGLNSRNHDFTPALETFRSAYESVDFMVVNLETSLGGDSKPYSGFPDFNAPDEIVTNLRDLGVDLQLLANNHIYDTGKEGFLRTISVVKQSGLAYTGVRSSEQESRYLLQDINGIRIGIINYTYEMEHKGEGKSLNGNVMDPSVENLINSYKINDLESFYKEMKQNCKELRNEGAEFIIAYMHWGNEYELTCNDTQKNIAQKLCDFGIDAVIGGHPHVVQPLDVLTSSDGSHKMFCAYSLGNHLSNQRRENISSRPNGHTEDGLMVSLTVSRIGGVVSITNVEAIPTYVYMTEEPRYYVIPIYNPEEVETQTGIAGVQAVIQASYDRTQNILGSCLEDVKRELGIPME